MPALPSTLSEKPSSVFFLVMMLMMPPEPSAS
jgi:hypothetical protein